MSGIRQADIPDIRAIVELGRELLETSAYSDIKGDEQKFKTLLAGLMGHKRGAVYVVVDDDDQPQGFLAGIVEEYGFSRARFGTDMYTYIRKPFRKYAFRLYKMFIEWAKSKPRVVRIEFAQSYGNNGYENWCKLMERLGLTKSGSIYSMRIEQCQAS